MPQIAATRSGTTLHGPQDCCSLPGPLEAVVLYVSVETGHGICARADFVSTHANLEYDLAFHLLDDRNIFLLSVSPWLGFTGDIPRIYQ